MYHPPTVEALDRLGLLADMQAVEVKAGQLKGIATSGLKRSAAAKNIPTVAESGLPGFDAVGWFGLFGPRNMPAAVVDALNVNVRQVLEEPGFQETAIGLAVDPQGGVFRRSERWPGAG